MFVTKAWLGTWAAIGALTVGSFAPPAVASAVPGLCEHRGAEHAAQHHMTREADSRYHVEHGELPTCGLDNDKDSSDRHDSTKHRIPRRDSPGFHCTWHGCG